MDSNKYKPDFFKNENEMPPIPKKEIDLKESDILEVIKDSSNKSYNEPKISAKLPPTRPNISKKNDNNISVTEASIPTEENHNMVTKKKQKEDQPIIKKTSSINIKQSLYILLLLISFSGAGYYYYLNVKNLKEYLSIKKHVENITKEMSKLTFENNQLVEKVVKSKKDIEDLTIFKQKYDEEVEKNKKLDEENSLLRTDYKNLEELVKTKKNKLKK